MIDNFDRIVVDRNGKLGDTKFQVGTNFSGFWYYLKR